MDLWSYSGPEHQGFRFFEWLIVLVVVGGCFIGIFGNGLDCPSSLLTQNGAPLKIVSRKNQTQREFCDASLETVCVQDLASGACRALVNLSVNLVAKGAEVVDFGLTLLATSQIGKREEIWCNVADLAKGPRFLDKLFTVSWLLDYDCCETGQSQDDYFSILSVSYYELEPCEAITFVRLKPQSNDNNSPVSVTVSKANDNTSTENFVTLGKDLSFKANSLAGLVTAAVMAVLGVVVTIIVIYIVCVKCDGGHCCKRHPDRCQHGWTPLQVETQLDCPHCKFEQIKVVAPEEDSVGCSITDIDIIPPTTLSSSSDEEVPEDKLDSGWFE